MNTGQSAGPSWYRANIWDLRPIFLSLHGNYIQIFAVLLVWSNFSDERSGLLFTDTSATVPRQLCHSWVQFPQSLGPYLTVSFETGFPFCRVLWLTGLRWRYSNLPPHGVGSNCTVTGERCFLHRFCCDVISRTSKRRESTSAVESLWAVALRRWQLSLGTVWEPRSRRTSAFGGRYRATAREGKAHWEYLGPCCIELVKLL
jgi:hypothetical protein